MRLPQEIIRDKRDGRALRPADIADFVAGVADGRVSPEQIAAFAMATCLRGMAAEETVALTLAMRDSGEVLDWRDLEKPVLDKHSTGGVGDAVSLMLAPLLAACGAAVPMISGRGLGHTGGTLDKLEAIPGYAAYPPNERFRAAVEAAGCAIVGQTGSLAPADGRIYAVRDVTATVESVPLITASILSKKLAAGLDALVMDVKTGSGAFMASETAARELAASLVSVARGAGLPTVALITGMDEPLGREAGNAVEVRGAIRFLTQTPRDPRMEAAVLGLAAELLVLGGLATDAGDADRRAREALDAGAAAERFARMVASLGGPVDLLARPEVHLPEASVVRDVRAETAGVVAAVDARALGLAVVELGGGRTKASDPVDPAVGLTAMQRVGARIEAGEPLALVHARDEAGAERAVESVRAAYRLDPGGTPAPERPVILGRVG
ncbi:thymidine phosphorylase [Antarcticirhabdus aurantiaca]|uniref:Thymidine phosphorylase n=1 Tax=Antarcticirhabdus aurantiaca TaxID=2606717 RepID=A0ACD4NT82_9HYPH|nr:thymidine phosphorylase [Antarcticirhabdus aurantiaca]WAJ29968.1 thymidine phosphorylase [Jeongeuplla avenae]